MGDTRPQANRKEGPLPVTNKAHHLGKDENLPLVGLGRRTLRSNICPGQRLRPDG